MSDLSHAIASLAAGFARWIETRVLTVENGIGLAVLALAAGIALWVGRAAVPRLLAKLDHLHLSDWVRTRIHEVARLLAPLTAALVIWVAQPGLAAIGLSPGILTVAAKLIAAFLLIRVLTALTGVTVLTRILAWIIWAVAALAILGWLDPLAAALDAVAITAGDTRLSLLAIINGMILVALLLWLAAGLASLIEAQLGRVAGISPAAQVLIGKISRIVLTALAVLIGLGSVGIDFTALAVLSGAIGVGIGFGLQKVVSNLVSGIILLLDRSIKPGDVIEIGEAYGWISKLGARYAAIVTRDGKEYLIPNEDLITHQVVNWSFSNRAVRLRIGVGVHYRSDLHRAMALMVEAGQEHPRVLRNPEPVARLIGFGDSAVDLELRVWIEDPEQGVVNVTSDIRLRIWDLFHENGIEFPFPQRDIHIVSAGGLREVAAACRPDDASEDAPQEARAGTGEGASSGAPAGGAGGPAPAR